MKNQNYHHPDNSKEYTKNHHRNTLQPHKNPKNDNDNEVLALLEEPENRPLINIDKVCKITHPHELTAILANMGKKSANTNKQIARDIFKNILTLPNLSDKDRYIIIEHMVDVEFLTEAEQQAKQLKNFILYTLAWKIITEKHIEKKHFKKAKKAAKHTGSKKDEEYYLTQIAKKQVSTDKIPPLTPTLLESGSLKPSPDPLLS